MKCELVGIGVQKGIQVAVCGMRFINLCHEVVKILDANFSYNSKIKKNVTPPKSFPTSKSHSWRSGVVE